MQSDQQYSSSCITAALLLIFLFSCASSQVSLPDTLRQGETLNTTSQLVSAGRIFTLGFYTPDRSNGSYLAIWYTNQSRPVWIGNRDNPLQSNMTISRNLTISSTGNLLITTHGIGENPINLYADEESRQNVSATLLDSGNFVLRQVSASGEVVLWQSFDYPTDTLLPGMKLGVNHRTGRIWTLSSSFRDASPANPENPATGPFTLEWDTALNRLIIRRRGVVYWTSGQMREYYVESESGNLRVNGFENMEQPDPFNFNYNFTHFTSNDEEYFMYSLLRVPNMTPDFRTVVSGWRLDYQGDIRDNDRPAAAMASLCYGYNIRGYGRGCELWEQPNCRTPRQNFSLRSGDFSPVGRDPPVYVENSNLSFSDCRQNCWNDCECGGFIEGELGCVYWRGRNLRFEQSLDGSLNRIYVLVSGSSNNRSRMLLWIIIAVVIATLLLLSVAVLVFLQRSKRRKREEEMHELLTLEGYTDTYEQEKGGANGHDLRMFAYASIVAATGNFSPKYKLGEGGFGSVYKGQTPEGHEIAVKLLSRSSGQGLLEFKTELILISKLQHVNLVKLVGFCVHGEDKMIVYNYMPNKSLDFYLFDPSKREELDWGLRFNIIEGIAQGLLYLHKYSRLSIVHRDLKCSNILLDENLTPKISDFGLARIFKQNMDEANTNRRVGTYGYMAPEYAMQGIFSYKSDVYSFGVLLLEIVSGRKNSSFHRVEGPLNLVEYAWELWSKESALELMDPTLSSSCNVEQFQRCINIGLLCVENRASDRPNTEDVISMLKNETASLRLPKNPSFITRNMVLEELGEKSTSEKLSGNEVSISEIAGR